MADGVSRFVTAVVLRPRSPIYLARSTRRPVVPMIERRTSAGIPTSSRFGPVLVSMDDNRGLQCELIINGIRGNQVWLKVRTMLCCRLS